MNPINEKWLPHTVTLFNLHRDDDGEIKYYRTILQKVRVGSRKTSLAASVRGVKKDFEITALIDPETSIAVNKSFIFKKEWEALADKEKYWTLDEGDWFVFTLGQIVTNIPDIDLTAETEQEFRNIYDIHVISSLKPIIDKDGTVHHWSVTFE